MSITDKHYHGGLELIYPFEEYGDTDTAFIKRIYHIDQTSYLQKKSRLGDELSFALLESFPSIRENRPWLVDTKTSGEPPGLVKVEEIYGYVPTAKHNYPSSISWTRPGIVFGSPTKPEWNVTNLLQLKVTLSSTPDFAEGAICKILLSAPFSDNTTQTLQSNDLKVRSISGNHVYVQDETSFSGTSMATIAQAYNTSKSQGGNPTVTLVVSAAGNRSPSAFNLPCNIVRDYFRNQTSNHQWLPPIIEPFSIRDSEGGIVESVGQATDPTITQYKARIGNMVVADYSNIGKVYGDVWYRETPYIRLV